MSNNSEGKLFRNVSSILATIILGTLGAEIFTVFESPIDDWRPILILICWLLIFVQIDRNIWHDRFCNIAEEITKEGYIVRKTAYTEYELEEDND